MNWNLGKSCFCTFTVRTPDVIIAQATNDANNSADPPKKRKVISA